MRRRGIHRGRLDKWMENSEMQLLIFRSLQNIFKNFENFFQKYFSKTYFDRKNRKIFLKIVPLEIILKIEIFENFENFDFRFSI